MTYTNFALYSKIFIYKNKNQHNNSHIQKICGKNIYNMITLNSIYHNFSEFFN